MENLKPLLLSIIPRCKKKKITDLIADKQVNANYVMVDSSHQYMWFQRKGIKTISKVTLTCYSVSGLDSMFMDLVNGTMTTDSTYYIDSTSGAFAELNDFVYNLIYNHVKSS